MGHEVVRLDASGRQGSRWHRTSQRPEWVRVRRASARGHGAGGARHSSQPTVVSPGPLVARLEDAPPASSPPSLSRTARGSIRLGRPRRKTRSGSPAHEPYSPAAGGIRRGNPPALLPLTDSPERPHIEPVCDGNSRQVRRVCGRPRRTWPRNSWAAGDPSHRSIQGPLRTSLLRHRRCS